MRFRTIWTIPQMAFRERLARTREWALRGIAHRLPRSLAYWSLIDSGARVLGGGTEVVSEIPFMEVVARAGKGVER